MKWKFLYNDGKPQLKFGASALAVGAIAASALSTGAAVYSNERNKSWQSDQLLSQQDYNTMEAERARLFSQQMQQQQLINDKELMGLSAYYSSPVYQSQQLQKANINPQVYFGTKGSFAGSSAPAAGIPAIPQASPASGLSPAVQPLDLQIPNLIQSIGSFVSNLSTAKKQGLETDVLDRTMDFVIDKMRNEANQAEIETALIDLNKQLQQSKLPYEIKHAALAVENTYSSIQLKKSEISKIEAETKLNSVLSRLNDVLADYKGEELTQLKLKWPLVAETMRSQIALNYASAENQKSQSDLAGANSAQVKFYNTVLQSDGVKKSLVEQAVEAGKAAVNANVLSQKQAKQLDYMISQAAYADDMKEFSYWSDQVSSFIGTIGQAASQFYGAGALRELINLRQQQQLPTSGFGAMQRPSPYQPYGR